MKILKQGLKPEDRVYRFSCICCGCEFECTRSECKYYAGDFRDGATVGHACPTCGTQIYVDPDRYIK